MSQIQYAHHPEDESKAGSHQEKEHPVNYSMGCLNHINLEWKTHAENLFLPKGCSFLLPASFFVGWAIPPCISVFCSKTMGFSTDCYVLGSYHGRTILSIIF